MANPVVDQLYLYGQLASMEWKAEQYRLTGMLISLMLCSTFLLCLLIALSGLVILFSWDTLYRYWAITALVGFHGLGTLLACFVFRKLASQGHLAFSDTREEIAVDIALLRQVLNP
jgi:uncharacterized membrane protein YqjE